MRILHYISHIDVEQGGVVRAVLNTADALTRSPERFERVTLATHRLTARDNAPGQSIAPTILQGGAGLLDRPRHDLIELVETHDVVHLHALWEPMNATIAALARARSIPYVVTTHGMLGRWPMSQKRLKKRIYLALRARRYLAGAHTLIFSCQDELEQSRAVATHPNCEIVPLVVALDAPDDGDDPEPRTPAPGARFRVAYLGRLHPVKGIDLLARAVELLVEQGRDVGLRIAGTGEHDHEQRIRHATAALREAGRCELEGFLDGPDKTAFLDRAHAFVLASEHENFGLSWAESMHRAVPTIVTPGVGPWREIRDAGGIVAQRTPESLADAIAGIIDDPSKATASARRASRWVREAFTPGAIAAQLARIYDAARVGTPERHG